MNAWIRTALALLLLGSGATAAIGQSLYEGQTIVTGRTDESLARGLPACFEEVLVKLSGDPRLIGDPRLADLLPQARVAIRETRFRDRLEGMPTHDEQGTRERPHDLTVRFDEAAIDAALRSLGREPWRGPRPPLRARIEIDNGARRYLLTRDGELGRDQRDALMAAARRFGLRVRLPAAAAEGAMEGEVGLEGTLVWRDDELGWRADWRLPVDGKAHRWGVRGVSFDAAFRSAMGGAAQLLSGNGHPP